MKPKDVCTLAPGAVIDGEGPTEFLDKLFTPVSEVKVDVGLVIVDVTGVVVVLARSWEFAWYALKPKDV